MPRYISWINFTMSLNGMISRNTGSHDTDSQSALTQIPLSTKLRNSDLETFTRHSQRNVNLLASFPLTRLRRARWIWPSVRIHGRRRLLIASSWVYTTCVRPVEIVPLPSGCPVPLLRVDSPIMEGACAEDAYVLFVSKESTHKGCDQIVPSSRSLAPKRVRRCS